MAENTRSNDKEQNLRARAIALREAGRSGPEIRAELGISGWTLTALLQGHVAPVHENLANRAKPELRAQARELREQGWTYPAIARKLRVSKSSLSLWLRDLPKPEKPNRGPPPEGSGMPQEEWEEHCARPSAAYWQKAKREIAETRQRRRDEDFVAATAEIGSLSDRELLLVGAAIYWCEGSKSKPWREERRVIFTNSDPGMIKLYLRFLESLGVCCDRLSFTLSIHETGDVEEATRYWARIVGVPVDCFKKPWIKKHNPTTVRSNVGNEYRGCLVVRVYRSAALYDWIEARAKAIMSGGADASES